VLIGVAQYDHQSLPDDEDEEDEGVLAASGEVGPAWGDELVPGDPEGDPEGEPEGDSEGVGPFAGGFDPAGWGGG
jgi:hypothetical protein